MHPEIVSLGPFTIRSYGLMLATGFLVGILIAARRARNIGENPDHIYNLSVWLVISSIAGARLYYIMTHYVEFAAPTLFGTIRNMFWPVDINGNIGISGLILYGGLIAATAVTVIYLAIHRLNIPRYLDIIGPSLGIGEFFTRIGCFLNGCCFGTPTDSACGIVFPQNSAAGYYYPDTPIYPSQLFSAFGGLAIFVLLILLERYKKFDGFTALNYFMLYALARFLIDFTRYYENSMTVFGLSQNQIISIVAFIAAAAIMTWKQLSLRRTR